MKFYFLSLLALIVFNACNSIENKEVQTEKYEELKQKIEADPSCAFEMKRIFSSPDKAYNITSGYRICKEEILTNEVIVFNKDEALGNKESNVYVSEDLRPIEVKWEGDSLLIYHYYKPAPLKKASSVYDVKVVYKQAEE
ncbi:MAG: hypothetical protein WD048_14180 [Chitinophagales bacterium]